MKEIVTASILFAISIFFIYKSIRVGQAEFDLAWEWLTKKYCRKGYFSAVFFIQVADLAYH